MIASSRGDKDIAMRRLDKIGELMDRGELKIKKDIQAIYNMQRRLSRQNDQSKPFNNMEATNTSINESQMIHNRLII